MPYQQNKNSKISDQLHGVHVEDIPKTKLSDLTKRLKKQGINDVLPPQEPTEDSRDFTLNFIDTHRKDWTGIVPTAPYCSSKQFYESQQLHDTKITKKSSFKKVQKSSKILELQKSITKNDDPDKISPSDKSFETNIENSPISDVLEKQEPIQRQSIGSLGPKISSLHKLPEIVPLPKRDQDIKVKKFDVTLYVKVIY
jgi:hypothetical protein